MISTLVLLTLAQADGGTVDVVSSASVKATVDAEVGFDVLGANVVNTAAGAGDPAEMTAYELGLHARAYATAFDRHGHFDLDYWGRQPIAGNSPNTPLHLLYKAELSADVLDKLLFIGLGRFIAPSATFLDVDGARVTLNLKNVHLTVFGGRRAITSSDASNVDLSTFLPAVGATLSLTLPRVQAELGASYTRDQAPQWNPETQVFDNLGTYDDVSAYARVMARPVDAVVLGAEIATAPSASYILGPTWNSVELTTASVNLFYVMAFAELRPHKTLRLSYDLHYQRAELFRDGYRLDPNDPTVIAEGFVPTFLDNRLRIKWRPFGLGWLGPEARFRARPDRNELRVGGFADLAPDWGKGFCVRASYTYEKMIQRFDIVPPADRSYWSASVGWRGAGLDLALGASDVERSALPVSGRVYTPYNDTPTQANDLAPFVLQAERIAFLRAFYGNAIWFAGVDFEQSLTDARERRFFAQIGARLEKEW